MNLPNRLTLNEGIELLQHATLEELQEKASSIRKALHPEGFVTYILDSNPNYSNICTACCTFCSFHRKEKDKEAFFKTVKEVLDDLKAAQSCGATSVLLQGGLSQKTTLSYLLELTKASLTNFPNIHPHFFSAPEIAHAAQISGVSIEKALKELYDAGLRTIPGAGAEILTERVRSQICPQKISAKDWLKIHKMAHTIGFRTTATMMFGHIETTEDIMEHLLKLREIQDETGGFLSFIPWSFKPHNNELGSVIAQRAPEESYFRILAIARLFLDNFSNISASWFGEGKKAGIKALSFGANDFGGTVFAESVHKSAGHENSSNEEEICQMIQLAGFIPKQRDSFFNSPYSRLLA